MIRTVLGDIEPEIFGVCYAHEHIIIDDNVATLRYPDFRLDSVENAVAELQKDGGTHSVRTIDHLVWREQSDRPLTSTSS